MRPISTLRGPVSIALLAVAFLSLALATRLPFRDRTMFISDSTRYALALERYDVNAGRPHPPGNPVYVGAVAVLDRVFDDPPTSLAVLSACLSGVAFLFAFLLGRDLAGETAGWIAAAILVVSPLFWFFGGLGMPSTGEAALSLLFAWMARKARSPVEAAAFWGMTLVLVVAFGFRSTFAILVLPLWIYSAWRHPARRIVAGAALFVVSAFLWTALVAHLSGGWELYRQTSASFFSEVVVATKLFGGGLAKIPRQLADIGISAVLGLGLFLVPCIAGCWRFMTGRWPFPGAAPFLAAWLLPATAFHAAYDWAPRFGVLLMPPAAILAAAMTQHLLQRGKKTAPWAQALVVLGLAVNLALFLLPERIGPLTLPEPYPSGSRLLARNQDLDRRDFTIRANLDPGETMVLAYDHTFHVSWFLPDYRSVGLFPVFKEAADSWVPSSRNRVFSFEPGSTAIQATDPIRIPPEVRQVVLYDDDYLPYWPEADLPLRGLPYDAGKELMVADLPGPGCLEYRLHTLGFLPAGSTNCEPAGEAVP